jgi:uncharacterized protein (TIGR02246 family)
MKGIRFVGVVVAVCAACVALSGARSAPGAGDEAAVRAAVLRELDGWSKFDAAEVASCYTVDTTWQNPFGVRIHGRADLQKFLTRLFERPGYRSAKDTMAPKITDIHMLSPTSAAVWSEEKSEGQIDEATGKPMKPRYSHYLEVFIKRNGEWLVSDSIIMDEYPRD